MVRRIAGCALSVESGPLAEDSLRVVRECSKKSCMEGDKCR